MIQTEFSITKREVGSFLVLGKSSDLQRMFHADRFILQYGTSACFIAGNSHLRGLITSYPTSELKYDALLTTRDVFTATLLS